MDMMAVSLVSIFVIGFTTLFLMGRMALGIFRNIFKE